MFKYLHSLSWCCVWVVQCCGAAILNLASTREAQSPVLSFITGFYSYFVHPTWLCYSMQALQIEMQSSNTTCSDFTTCTRCVGQWMIDTEAGSSCLWCSAPKADSNGELTVIGCIERTGAADVCPYGRLQATCGTAYSSYVFILALASTLCCCCGLLMLRRFLASWAGQREWRGSSGGSLDLLRPLLDDEEEDTYEGVFGASFR
jgi:hypothetical protein